MKSLHLITTLLITTLSLICCDVTESADSGSDPGTAAGVTLLYTVTGGAPSAWSSIGMITGADNTDLFPAHDRMRSFPSLSP
ncbi:MAG: hypothetical protein GF331_16690, partial [Chitinivibrionales bacterium]|nr:hypothetical protein [Chitinivibrionales bacterium]